MATASPHAPPPPPPTPELVPEPPPRVGRAPRKLGLLFLVAGLAAGYGLYRHSQRQNADLLTGGGAAVPRTAVAGPAELVDILRVSGAVTARDYAAIRAPELRGVRQNLTLVELAPAGTVIPAGSASTSVSTNSTGAQHHRFRENPCPTGLSAHRLQC